MTIFRTLLIAALALIGLSTALTAETNTVALSGYDAVSYHIGEPQRGSGNHVATFEGATYIFANAENLETFKKDPAKYAPAYGGYCAYGAALGKKFVSDPLVYKVVDGRLYLNLNEQVAKRWNEDVPGYIVKADEQWKTIADVPAGDL